MDWSNIFILLALAEGIGKLARVLADAWEVDANVIRLREKIALKLEDKKAHVAAKLLRTEMKGILESIAETYEEEVNG